MLAMVPFFTRNTCDTKDILLLARRQWSIAFTHGDLFMFLERPLLYLRIFVEK